MANTNLKNKPNAVDAAAQAEAARAAAFAAFLETLADTLRAAVAAKSLNEKDNKVRDRLMRAVDEAGFTLSREGMADLWQSVGAIDDEGDNVLTRNTVRMVEAILVLGPDELRNAEALAETVRKENPRVTTAQSTLALKFTAAVVEDPNKSVADAAGDVTLYTTKSETDQFNAAAKSAAKALKKKFDLIRETLDNEQVSEWEGLIVTLNAGV